MTRSSHEKSVVFPHRFSALGHGGAQFIRREVGVHQIRLGVVDVLQLKLQSEVAAEKRLEHRHGITARRSRPSPGYAGSLGRHQFVEDDVVLLELPIELLVVALFGDMDGRGRVPLIASSETAFAGLYGLGVEFIQGGSGGLFVKHVSGNYRFARK